MKLKTFFVEDNPVIRQNLMETLEEMSPVEVVGYAEGEDSAKEWFRGAGGNWHLAIVDVFLAQGNGLGVLQDVTKRESHQKVVVLSNYATDDIKRRCRQLGADAVFDKSNELDDFVEYCVSLAASG